MFGAITDGFKSLSNAMPDMPDIRMPGNREEGTENEEEDGEGIFGGFTMPDISMSDISMPEIKMPNIPGLPFGAEGKDKPNEDDEMSGSITGGSMRNTTDIPAMPTDEEEDNTDGCLVDDAEGNHETEAANVEEVAQLQSEQLPDDREIQEQNQQMLTEIRLDELPDEQIQYQEQVVDEEQSLHRSNKVEVRKAQNKQLLILQTNLLMAGRRSPKGKQLAREMFLLENQMNNGDTQSKKLDVFGVPCEESTSDLVAKLRKWEQDSEEKAKGRANGELVDKNSACSTPEASKQPKKEKKEKKQKKDSKKDKNDKKSSHLEWRRNISRNGLTNDTHQ